MDLTNLTEVIRFETTDDGFIFYDEHGNIPDPSNSYWEGDLNLDDYNGESLNGLPNVVNGHLYLWSYNGKALKGLPNTIKTWLYLNQYKGNDLNHLPKDYTEICIKDKWYTKAEMDDFLKTEKLKKVLLD